MIAFAANSLLCRMALGQGLVDAASFTSIRIISGALVLLLIVSIRGHATKITTVSPRYASEIRTPEGGFGLAPVLDHRGGDLVGILNGLDDVGITLAPAVVNGLLPECAATPRRSSSERASSR